MAHPLAGGRLKIMAVILEPDKFTLWMRRFFAIGCFVSFFVIIFSWLFGLSEKEPNFLLICFLGAGSTLMLDKVYYTKELMVGKEK
jgi:hypothetical protein